MSSPSANLDSELLQEVLGQLPTNAVEHLLFNAALDVQKSSSEAVSNITTLSFEGYGKPFVLDQFLQLRDLSLVGLRHLDLSWINLKTEEERDSLLSFIAQCPAFNNLETLAIKYCGLQNLSPLTNGPNTFPNLISLDLSFNRDLDLPTLVDTAAFPNITSLNLSGTALSVETATALSQSKTFATSLQELSLDSTSHRHDTVFTTLIRAPCCANLIKLEVSLMDVSASFKIIVEEGLLSKLQILDFSWSSFSCEVSDPANLADFIASPLAANLTAINFAGIKVLSKESFAALASHPNPIILSTMPFSSAIVAFPDFPHKVTSIKFQTDAPLTKNDVEFVSCATCFSSLDQLDLYNLALVNQDSDFNWAVATLAGSPNVANIRLLKIHRNLTPLDAEAIEAILTSPYLTNLIRLELHLQPALVGKHVHLLTQELDEKDQTKGLKFGKLEFLKLTNSGLCSGDAVRLNKLSQLKTLDLSRNISLSDKDLLALIELDSVPFSTTPIPLLHNLTSLDLMGAEITEVGFNALAKSPVLEQMTNMTLSCVQATAQSVIAFIEAPQGASLTKLTLFDCDDDVTDNKKHLRSIHPARTLEFIQY